MRYTHVILVIALVVAGFACTSEAQDFTATGNMTTTRVAHTATLLNNGEVLVAGGENSNASAIASAELYNPTTGTFTATGSMHVARLNATATLLQNGMVLIAGGQNGDITYLSEAELYNPATGTFTVTGSLNAARGSAMAALLSNGEVLIAGGIGTGGGLASAELYNPSTGTFTYTGSMSSSLFDVCAVMLMNGTVMIVGGDPTEIYNPSTRTFSTTGSPNTFRTWPSATLLGNGEVLLAGGYNYYDGGQLASAEIYNPSSGTFSYTGSLNTKRDEQQAVLLNDGTVLVVGGTYSTNSAELYNPSTGTFSVTGSTSVTLSYGFTATKLDGGEVLVAGGAYYGNSGVATAELYTAAETGYIDPKFIVVGVTYAPPGPSSSTWVSYGNSTTIGTTNSLSNSFMGGDTYSVSLSSGFSIPLVGSAKITDSYSTTSSETTKNTSSVTMTFETSTAEKTFGTGSYWAPVDNDYDTIWVWLNPALIFTVSGDKVTWNGYGIDDTDQPGMDIVGIPLGYLNGKFGTMPPDIQTSLNRTWAASQLPAGQNPAVTSAYYAQIASADPFSVSTYGPEYIGADPPTPQTADYRFTMSACTGDQSFDYIQAAPSQSPAIYTCTLTYTNTSTQAQDITSTYSQTYSVDSAFTGSGFLSSFSSDVKNSDTLTWTTEEQNSISNSTTSTASLSVQGPPCNNQVPEQGPCIPVYDSSGTEPVQFYIYEDNMYGTFMFAPVDFY